MRLEAPAELTLLLLSAVLSVSAPTHVAPSTGKIILARDPEPVEEVKNLPQNKTSPKAFLKGDKKHQD